MNTNRVHAILCTRAAKALISVLFVASLILDLFIFSANGTPVNAYFGLHPTMTRWFTAAFCLFVMLMVAHCVTSSNGKNKVGWMLLFFFTGFLAAEVYFATRMITGWDGPSAG